MIIGGFDWVWSDLGLQKEMVGVGFDWVCWDLGFLFSFDWCSLVGLIRFDQIWV